MRSEPNSSPATLLFLCEFPECNKAFSTKTGLGVHQQRIHKAWYDARQLASKPKKKAGWTQEELTILAKKEASRIISEERPSLQILTKDTGRTLEAVKSQRRSTKYQQLVSEFIKELQEKDNRMDPPSKSDYIPLNTKEPDISLQKEVTTTQSQDEPNDGNSSLQQTEETVTHSQNELNERKRIIEKIREIRSTFDEEPDSNLSHLFQSTCPSRV